MMVSVARQRIASILKDRKPTRTPGFLVRRACPQIRRRARLTRNCLDLSRRSIESALRLSLAEEASAGFVAEVFGEGWLPHLKYLSIRGS